MSKRFLIIVSGAVIVIILAAVLYLVTIGGAEGQAEKKSKIRSEPAEINIVFLGSTYSSNRNWHRHLSRKDVDFCAVINFSRRELKMLLERCVWKKNPKICFLNGGHEDVISNVPLKTFLENYEWVVKKLMKRDIRPVIQSTIRIPEIRENVIEEINVMNDRLKLMADSMGVDYINITEILCNKEGLKEKYTPDGIHLNEVGYKAWAEEIKAYLKENPI